MVKNYRAQMMLGFCRAWENLLDFPMPNRWSCRCSALEKELENADDSTSQGFFDLLFFPVIGFLAGFIFLLLAGAVNLVLDVRATAVLFGVTATLFLESKDHGRGLVAVIVRLKRIFSDDDSSRETRIDELKGAVSSTLLTVLMLFKMAVLGLLYYRGCGMVFAAVLLCDCAVQGELAGYADASSDGKALIECSSDEKRLIRFAGVLLLFIATLSHLGIFLGALFTAAAVALFFERAAFGRGSLKPADVTFAGAAANLLVLFVALLLLLKF